MNSIRTFMIVCAIAGSLWRIHLPAALNVVEAFQNRPAHSKSIQKSRAKTIKVDHDSRKLASVAGVRG